MRRQLTAELRPVPLTSQSGCRRLLHTTQPTWCVSPSGRGDAPFLKSSTNKLELHSCTEVCRVTASKQQLEPSLRLHSLYVQEGRAAGTTLHWVTVGFVTCCWGQPLQGNTSN